MRTRRVKINEIDVGTHFIYEGIDGVPRRYQKCEPSASRGILLYMLHSTGKSMPDVQFAVDNFGFIQPFNQEILIVLEQGE